MLTAGAGAPRPPRPPPTGSTPRHAGALVGLAILILVAVLFFSLRGGKSEPASTVASARGNVAASTSAQTTPPRARAPREKAARRPSARSSAQAAAEPAEPEAPQLQAGDVSDPALKSVLAARDDRSPEGTRTLIDNLGSSDAIVVAEACKALIARQATEALAPLAKISLEKAAGSGLSVIDALGKLGGAAEGNEQSAAVDRLLQMLREEKRRHAPESAGNLLQIYEALGDTRAPDAARALEAELLDASVPRAPKVVIVHALVDIGLASSKDALGKARSEQATQQGEDAFEEEIRKELVAALEEAIEAL